MPTPADTAQDAMQPQAQGATGIQEQEQIIVRQQEETALRMKAILQAIQQNPQLGNLDEFRQKLLAMDKGMQNRLQPLQQQQEALQQQIMDYQPQSRKDQRTKKLWIAAIVSGVSSALISVATFFTFKNGPQWLRKRSEWTKGATTAGMAVGVGPIIGTVAAQMFTRKKEKGSDAKQIVLAQKNIEQGMLDLLAESVRDLSGLCDEYEAQIKSCMQQLSATAAPAPVPVRNTGNTASDIVFAPGASVQLAGTVPAEKIRPGTGMSEANAEQALVQGRVSTPS